LRTGWTFLSSGHGWLRRSTGYQKALVSDRHVYIGSLRKAAGTLETTVRH